jgi:flagellar assembly protein FliH
MLDPRVRRAKLDDLSSDVRKAQLDQPALERPAPEKTPPAVRVADELARARKEAYEQGLAAGREEASTRMDAERAALHRVTEAFQEMMQEFEQGLANDVLSMSLELAKLIVRQAIRVHPQVVLTVVREAVSSLAGMDAETTVHLHPDDAALLKAFSKEDAALASLPWKIVEDARIERGGCRLETASTELDATLETRWRRVIAALGREDSWIDITL